MIVNDALSDQSIQCVTAVELWLQTAAFGSSAVQTHHLQY